MSADEMGLGTALRAWRDRLSPAAVGLQPAVVRRAPGLRREELADLAGLSVDYVVRLEQGRATTPSAQVAATLARALQLTREERDHLYRLAGLHPPSDSMISDHIPVGLHRVLQRLGDAPVAVFAADWRLLWWNSGWSAVLGDPVALPPDERSLVRSRFPTAGEHSGLGAWPVIVENVAGSDRAIVSDLRTASARYPDDPRLSALIHRTVEGNAHFAELWRSGVVGNHTEDRKTILHPTVGPITVDCDVISDQNTGLKIVIFTAQPESEDQTKLDLARIGGVRSVAR